MESPKRIPYRPLGVSLRDFARQRIRTYVPSGDLVSRSALPPSWAGAASEPLDWQGAATVPAPGAPEPAISAGTDVDAVVRRVETPAAAHESPEAPLNDGFGGMEAQLKAIVAAHERKRAEAIAAASAPSVASVPGPSAQAPVASSESSVPGEIQRSTEPAPAAPVMPRRRRGSVVDVTPPQPTGVFDEREWDNLPAQPAEPMPGASSTPPDHSGAALAPTVNHESNAIARAEAPAVQRSPAVPVTQPADTAPVTDTPESPADWVPTTSAPTPARVQRVTLDEPASQASATGRAPEAAAEAAAQRAEAPAASPASVPTIQRSPAALESAVRSPDVTAGTPSAAPPRDASPAPNASTSSPSGEPPALQRRAESGPATQRAPDSAVPASVDVSTPAAGSTTVVPPASGPESAAIQRAEAPSVPSSAPARQRSPALTPPASAPQGIDRASATVAPASRPSDASHTAPAASQPEGASAETQPIRPQSAAPGPSGTVAETPEAQAAPQTSPSESQPVIQRSTGPAPASAETTPTPPPAVEGGHPSPFRPDQAAAGQDALTQALQRAEASTAPPAELRAEPRRAAPPGSTSQAAQTSMQSSAANAPMPSAQVQRSPAEQDSVARPAAIPAQPIPTLSQESPANAPMPSAQVQRTPAEQDSVARPAAIPAQPTPTLSQESLANAPMSSAQVQRTPADDQVDSAPAEREFGPLAEALRAAEQPAPDSSVPSAGMAPPMQRAAAPVDSSAPRTERTATTRAAGLTPGSAPSPGTPGAALPDAPTALEPAVPTGISEAIQRAIAAAESPSPAPSSGRPARAAETPPAVQRALDGEDAPTVETPAARPAPVVLDSKLQPSPWVSFMQKPEPPDAPPAPRGAASGSRVQRAVLPASPAQVTEPPPAALPPHVTAPPAPSDAIQRALAQAEAPVEQEVDLYTALVAEGLVPPPPPSERPSPGAARQGAPSPTRPSTAPGIQRQADGQSITDLPADQLPPASNVPEPGSVEAAMLDLLNLPPNTSVYGLKGPAPKPASDGPTLQRKPLDQALADSEVTVSNPRIQRAITIDELEVSTGEAGSGQGNEPNIDDLARKVYRILKDRLRIERERSAR